MSRRPKSPAPTTNLNALLADAAELNASVEEEQEPPPCRLDANVYMERLKEQRGVTHVDPKVKERERLRKKKKNIIPGADFLESIPHAPWPSRSLLKRRIVLGTENEILVSNGVTRVPYQSGAVYEGEVQNGKRHGNGMLTWADGQSYQGMWYLGLPHGLGVAEYGSGASYCGEWYLGDRHGYGMYFYAEHPDEPHAEYVGQWRNDLLYGVGKRLSKDGTLYLGNWKRGLRHGDGVARVCHAPIWDLIGTAENALRKGKGGTGRYSAVDAKTKSEVDMTKIMGGLQDWTQKAWGIVIQEGRFDIDDYVPRDKHEIRTKLAKIERAKTRDEMIEKGMDPPEDEYNDAEEDDPQSKANEKRAARQARIRALVKKEGRVLASKDFPKDPVDWLNFETFVQVGMEHSDAAELLAQKVRSKFHKVNMNFRVSHFETHPRGYEHAVSDFNREKAYG